MVGKLTWTLLAQGIYPYYLNIAFWERFKYPLAKTPLKAFASVRSLRRIVMAVWIATVAATTAFTYFVPPRGASPLVAIYSFVTFIAGFLFFVAPLMPGTRSLKLFERELEKVLGMLSFARGARPVHLMTLVEVRTGAEEIILSQVDKILGTQENNGRQGSREEEEYRKNLRETFDLFMEYGLIYEKANYEWFFEKAAQRRRNQHSEKEEVVPE